MGVTGGDHQRCSATLIRCVDERAFREQHGDLRGILMFATALMLCAPPNPALLSLSRSATPPSSVRPPRLSEGIRIGARIRFARSAVCLCTYDALVSGVRRAE